MDAELVLRSISRRAQVLLQEPLVGSQIAAAYNMLHYVRQFPGTASENEIKQATLLTRELLVQANSTSRSEGSHEGYPSDLLPA